jgi:galactose-1-phosphate uridylyltransferase
VKKIRKHIPGKRKREKKEANERLEKQAAAFLDHPKECCVCKTEFERTHETVKTWQVSVVEDRVRLTCPDCWGKINEVLENIE